MNWIMASVVTLILWGSYSIFGEKATRVHGEKVSFIFELIGMVITASVVFAIFGGINEFKKITAVSAFNATIMGLMVAIGTFTLLYAFRVMPSVDQFPVAIIIAGSYPVVTAILSYFFLDSKLSLIQWSGVILAGVAIALVNWSK
jgi:drug/metabolite transporter (DMT)-like permease